MDLAQVMLVATAITTALMQVFKKTVTTEDSKFRDYLEFMSILVGIAVFYMFSKANNVDVSNLWNAAANGLMVGLASIGAYQTTGATPGAKVLVK
jgi:hypothetical protein